MYEVAVVVTYSATFPWKLLRLWGFGTWSHAALRYVREEYGRPAGRPNPSPRVIESAACGVRERSWDEFVAECDEYRLLRLKQELPEANKREIIAYAWGNVGKPYNFLWLLQVAWRLIREQWFVSALTYPAHICSSLVYDAYSYGRIDLLPGQPDILVTPDDLASSPLLAEVEVSLAARLRRLPGQSRTGSRSSSADSPGGVESARRGP